MLALMAGIHNPGQGEGKTDEDASEKLRSLSQKIMSFKK